MTRPVTVLLLSVASVAAQPRKGPVNLDFSDSVVGQLPVGWMAPVADRGFPAVATDQCSKPGARCGVVRSAEVAAPGPFGNLMQYFDAAPYRSKKVRFRASVRVDAASIGRAQLWLRVDRPNQKKGFFDNMGNRPIISREWQTYEISGEVSEDAIGIAMGMMLVGGQGAAYIDNVSFEITGEVQPAQIGERSRALAGRGLENLAAYARLLGYIRHFYPGDEAFHADWDAVAIAGVPIAESATDSADLASKLDDFFRPVAPAVRVFPGSAPTLQLELGSGSRMISWHHSGFGGGGASQNIYHSERVTSEAPGGRLPEPFLADLGGGVKALVPLALFVDGKGTQPHPVPPAPKRDTAARRYTGDDRATRIADVVIAWNILQHFYPYFDVVSTDWPNALRAALTSAAADRNQDDFAITLRRLVAALKDGHGRVNFGSGLRPAPIDWDWIEDQLVVTYLPDMQGQPVERGDTVLAINGQLVAKAMAEAEAVISGATPQWIRYRALADLSMGPADQPLVLEIEPYRNPANHQTITVRRNGGPIEEPRPEKIAELRPGIYYVDLTRITDEDWKAALSKLEKASGIVFDLRGYPGRIGPNWLTHLSHNAMTSAQWHVPSVTRPDHQNMEFVRQGEWHLMPSKPYLSAKRVVLTNGHAISYAESTMGIVEAYKLAEIVGSTTAGTNGNVNPISLPGGYHISWTGMKVLKHDGSQHHGVGIKPTIPVERTRAGVAAGKDEILERGIQALQ